MNNSKDYNVRLICPHGDGDQWVLLQNRAEALTEVLETAWDFECPAHGVQREFPLAAIEQIPQPLSDPAAHPKSAESSKKRPKELRHRREVRVRVRGRDRYGNVFTQTAFSVNISRSGARLHGIGSVTPGQTVEVRRFLRNARFSVIWTGQRGTPLENEMGICCLNPNKNFWGLPAPGVRR
ncbi:MAG: hypothetical protein HYX72_12160 [Acidobacteria bacterium]|nr:hypothetical protein [Acidobacteriota bacterium]